jgi:hypothetical protein
VVTPEQFCAKFSGICGMLNWQRFLAEKWPLEIVLLTDRQAFAHIRLSWFLSLNNVFVAFDEPGATPVRLDDVQSWYPFLPPKHKNRIEQRKREYLDGSRKPEFEFPSYAIPTNEHLVLDANHRLSALALSGASFLLHMFVLEGPLDPDALADLQYLCLAMETSNNPMRRPTV